MAAFGALPAPLVAPATVSYLIPLRKLPAVMLAAHAPNATFAATRVNC